MTNTKNSKVLSKKSKVKPRGSKAKDRLKSRAPSKGTSDRLAKKIRELATKTQRRVKGELTSKSEALSDALKEKLSAYGIGVDDVRAKAKLLEKVLQDIKGREFLKQPGIQSLVEKVNRRSIEKSNFEAQRMAEKLPRTKKLQRRQKQNRQKQLYAFLKSAEMRINEGVVQSVIKRVEDVKRALAEGRRKK